MLSEQELIRRESLQKLIDYGINPYPAQEFNRSHFSSEIKENFNEGEKVIIAGRLLRRKIQGKASFGVIQDSKGKIQVYFNRDTICPDENKDQYNTIFKKWLDLGDFLGIEGEPAVMAGFGFSQSTITNHEKHQDNPRPSISDIIV